MEVLSAQLQLDISAFQAALAAASQQVSAFAQSLSAGIAGSSAAFQQQVQQINQVAEATRKAAETTKAVRRSEVADVGENTKAMVAAYKFMEESKQQLFRETNTMWARQEQERQNLLQQATSQTTVFDAAIARIGTSLRTLGGYLVAGAIIRLPFELAQWGKESVDTAVKMQSLQATFTAIAGGAAAGQRELENIRRVAQRAGVDFLEAATSFKSFEAAARGTRLEGEAARRIFEQVTNAARVMGLTSEQVSRLMLALEQMISRGTVSAEELRKQLGNALPGAVQIMSRALGITTAELGDLMKNAELAAVDVLPKFGNQLQREFGPGFAAAAETAQSTFARFGNNVRDVSVSVGENILTILKPVVDVINRGFELYQKARDEAAKQRNEGVGTPPAKLENIPGAPDLNKQVERARQLLEENQEVLRVMNESRGTIFEISAKQILDQEDIVRRYEALWKRMQKTREDFLAAQEETGAGATEAPFVRQTKAVGEAVKDLDVQLGRLAQQRKLFPAMITGDGQLDLAREKVREIGKAIEKVSEEITKSKGLSTTITDPLATQAKDLNTRMAAAKEEVATLEDAEEKRKEAAREEIRLQKERDAEMKRNAADRIALEDKMRVEIAAFEGNSAGKIRETLTQTLGEAKRLYTDQTLTAQFESVKRMQAAQTEGQRIIAEHDAVASGLRELDETQRAIAEETTALSAEGTQTRLDDFIASLEKRKAAWQDELDYELITQKQFDDFVAAAEGKKNRIIKEEQDKLNKEAAKPWRELAQTIEGTLSSAFESVLSGSKSLFEGIRDAFLKLLAKLAADALANAIIIPVLMNFVGGGGIGGLGGAISSSGLGNLGFAGAGGTTGGVDASGGAGGALGTAVGFASSANSISGALGGPSIGIGTFLGSTALGSTELGELGLSGAGYIGGSEGLIGPLGPATTTLAGAAGTVIGGVGAGVAVGMILSKINSLIGFHGTGSAVAAGAGGGAAAGALIGSAFPIIGTGIGAGVGAAIGALGGFISTLFGKNAKQPGFQIESLQPGQIEYDTSIGLRVKQDFKILDDFHQKLGVDYEDFTKTIEDGFNTLFEHTVSQISGASPEVQRALVEPLNAAFQDVAAQIEAYPKIGGDDFKKQLEKMMGEDIPKIFTDAANGAIGKLVDAVKKIDPVVQAFNKIIDAIMQDIDTLRQQQLALDTSLAANIKTLRESLYTPQQLLAARAQELGSLMNRFDTGSEGDKIILAPAIGQLAVEVMGLAKSVEDLKIQEIGRTISQATTQRQTDVVTQGIKTLSEALFTPRQTLGARQTDLSDLMDQFRAGDTTIRLLLAPQITQLALQIMDLAKGVDDLAASQALLAEFPAQLRTLKEALYSPAQTFLSLQSQFDELMAQFRAGSPDQRTTLEPQIAQLASQILELAKGQDVLGQDPQLLRQTQTALLAAVQEMQNVITAQATAGTNNQANIQAVLEATNAALINTLQEVQVGVASSVADSGREVIQAVYATAGQIILTSWNTSNGVINAEYASANGMISAQYTTSGGLVNAQYTTAGGVINAQYATANNMVSAQYINANGVVTAAYNSAAGVAGSVYYSTGALAGAIYDTQGQVIGVQYAVGNQISNTVAAYGAWNANGVAGSNYLLNWMGNNIWYTQNALIGQVASVRDTAWATYNGLVGVLYAEIGKAQEQINLLVGALYHLETLDDVLRNALGVLGAMNARLGNPLQVNMGESLMTQLQRESTWWQQQQYHLTQNANVGVIALLNRIAGATDWEGSMALGRLFASGQAGGFQHGGYVPRNMFSVLHAGEQVIPEWSNRGNNRGSSPINIHVYGGNKDVTQIADAVMDRIEQKSGRLQSSRIQTRGR